MTDFIEIVFPPNSGVERDVLEDEIEERFPGAVEVTGGGSGNMGSNLDLEITGVTGMAFLDILIPALRNLGVPPGTRCNHAGETRQVYE